MHLNRKWLMVVALVLSLTIAATGTLAYMTDRDTTKNTFTMGNVDIRILENFKQDSELAPGVKVDKGAAIENIHNTEPAYVWMVVSVPTELDPYIDLGWANGYSATPVESPYENYTGHLVKYPEELAAKDATENLLTSVTLKSTVDYQNGEYVVIADGKKVTINDINMGAMNIVVDAYAIQTDGFEDVDDAYTKYNTQWEGVVEEEDPTPEPEPENKPKEVTVHNQQELQEALNAAEGEVIIILADDIEGNITVPQSETVKITIRGEGNVFDGAIIVDGRSSTPLSAGLVIENLHFTAADKAALGMEACINLGDGTSGTRYTCNVTVKGCSFNVKDAVGIKSYTGGDYNLTVANCLVGTAAHSLMQVDNIKDSLLIKNCEINSVRGMSFNQTQNVVIDNCTFDVQKYAVRFGDTDGTMGTQENYLIKNSTLHSSVVEDATIVFRGTAEGSTLTLENTTVTAADDTKRLTNTVDAIVVGFN